MPLTLRPPEGENLAGQDTGREHLSHSSVSTLLSCRRKYQLAKVDRLELVTRPAALRLGAAYQKAIELQAPEVGPRILRGWLPCELCGGRGSHTETLHALGKTLIGKCPACDARGGEQGPGPRITSQEDEDRLQVEEATVEAAAALYLRTWPATDQEQREVEYRVRLRNPATGAYSLTFDLLGYADGVVDCDSWLELIENKLVGQITELSVKRLPLDRQIALARYGLWRATGKQVRRVHYRFVRKPSIKQRQKETLPEFLARLRADYEEREDFYAVQPDPMFAPHEDALRVEAELWEWADDVRRGRRRQVWPRNTSHCTDFGGCAFIPICTGDPDARALYRVREPHHDPRHVAQEAA